MEGAGVRTAIGKPVGGIVERLGTGISAWKWPFCYRAPEYANPRGLDPDDFGACR